MVLNSEFKVPNARELFKSFKNAKGEWKFKTPMQKWCFFFGIGKAPLDLVYFPTFRNVNDVHWFGYFVFVYQVITILLSLYTVLYFAFRGEIQMGLPSTCMASIVIGHVPTTFVFVFNNRFKLQDLIVFGGRYIYHDSHEKTEYNRICSDHMDKTMKRFIIKMGAVFVSFSIGSFGPTYAYFSHGILTTTIEARIPFTKPKSNAEFIGNVLVQSMNGVHGGLCYIALETILCLLENAVTITPRLIECELVHTIQLYEKISITELELNSKIGNIVKQSTDADNYVDTLSQLFYWRNLFTPVTFTYMIGMGIFCQYTVGFEAGYGLAILSWIQLFYVCEVGENIQDNGCAEMLYQTKWEVLPLHIQKVIMLLIHRKQNERGLKLGPFGVGINRESFQMSTNKICTFVMFLLNFFESG